MRVDAVHIICGIAVGLGATGLMDLWALFLKRVFSLSSLNYCFVGRWLLHMREGIFKHDSIARAPRRSGECTVGWIAHYAIGTLFALAFLLLVSPKWLQQPTILPPVLWGLVTVAVPFLIMQPSFGLGIASSKTAAPMQARLRSLMTHTVYGVGLYLSAVALSLLLKAHA